MDVPIGGGTAVLAHCVGDSVAIVGWGIGVIGVNDADGVNRIVGDGIGVGVGSSA